MTTPIAVLIVHHGSSPLAAISLIVFLILLRASAVDLHSLELLIGATVRDCLRRSGITEEQAADLMRMPVCELRKCLRGEGRLQLGVAKLMRLGLTFWTYLTPTLLYHAARLHAEQVREDAIDAAKALLGRKTF